MKAAFLLNFGRFVEWPSSTFAAPDEPFVIGIFGDTAVESALKEVAKGKSVNGHPLKVRRLSDAGAVKSCQVVFLAAGESRRSAELLAASAQKPILMVGEDEGFANDGGIINFVVRDKRVRFELNTAAAAGAGLTVSSKLLQLAILVGEGRKK